MSAVSLLRLKKHIWMSHKNKILATEQPLQKAFVSLGLSARSHDRIIKVAQTIADLKHSDVINTFHLAEAIELRTISKG